MILAELTSYNIVCKEAGADRSFSLSRFTSSKKQVSPADAGATAQRGALEADREDTPTPRDSPLKGSER